MTFRSNLERIAEIYGGIAIFSVDPGSTTHRAGVRAGDVLVAVNGRRVRRLAEYAAARQLRQDLLELVVVRGGKTMTLWANIRIPQDPAAAHAQGEAAPAQTAASAEVRGVTCKWRGAA